jgi:Cu/Ag efflux pump CusA
MFTFLVTHSLRNRLLVMALAVVLVVWGAFTATHLPVDVLPDLNKPTVTIMTEAEGLAPPEVEQLVSFVIETQMNGVSGVSRVRSVSGSTGERTSTATGNRSPSALRWSATSFLRTSHRRWDR